MSTQENEDIPNNENISETLRIEPIINEQRSFDALTNSFVIENKPFIKIEVSLSVTQRTISDLFIKLCKSNGYEIIDNEKDQITAIKIKRLTIKDCLLYCLPCINKNQPLFNCVRLTMKVNKLTCKRKIIIKALFGDSQSLQIFLNQAQAEMDYYESRGTPGSKPSTLSILTDSNTITNNYTGSIQSWRSNRYAIINEDNDDSDHEDNPISANNLESYSYYEFNKILSSSQYNLGKKILSFINDFSSIYHSIEESAELLPQPMESIYTMINEAVDTLFYDFNYGKSETKKIMPYCRIAVEKYLFDKVYGHLFEIYKKKYELVSIEYKKQCEEIMHSYQSNPIRILKYLDVNKKFWLVNSKYLDKNDELIQSKDIPIPYHDSILELNKLYKLKTPREKLNVLLMMHSLMKSEVVEFHKGKEELSSMDDELPIIIYIVLMANLKDGEAELAYIEDFINLDQSLESEKRLMTNLRVSIQYIVKEWKIE